MFDIPPQRVRAINRDVESKQLQTMTAHLPHIENEKSTIFSDWICAMGAEASKMDIYTTYNSIENRDGSFTGYFITSTNKEIIDELNKTNFADFDNILDKAKNQDRGIIQLDTAIFKVSDMDRENFFAKNSEIMRYIQHQSVAAQAFLNAGYKIPEYIHETSVESIWELDHMRASPAISEYQRKEYQEIYDKAIKTYDKMYNKTFSKVFDLPKKHRVRESYFKKNHIPVNYGNMNPEFYDYMKTELKKGRFPDFKYHKEATPFIQTKNLSKKFKKLGINGPDFWEKDTGTTMFYITYPQSQQDIYYTLLNEFNTRYLESRISLEEIKKEACYERPLQTIYIHQYDLANWNRLCSANNIKWAVDDGSVCKKNLTPENGLEKIPVCYGFKDLETVGRIVDRLQMEIRTYNPVSEFTLRETGGRKIEDINKIRQKHHAEMEM